MKSFNQKTSEIPHRSILWYAFMTLLMFLYIYEFNFNAFGLSTFLTSRRVVVVVLLIMAIIVGEADSKTKNIGWKSLKAVSKFHIFLLGYSGLLLVLIGRGTGIHIVDCIIRLFLFGFLPVWCFTRIFRTLDEFMVVVLLATIIQSGFIVTSLINPSFGMFLDLTFADADKADYIMRHRSGYAGGLACITAPGCLRFSMGLVSSLYFALNKSNPFYLILFVVLGIIATMIARTGLFICIVGFIIISIQKGTNSLVKYFFSIVMVGVVALVFSSQISIRDYFDFKRMEMLLYEDDGEAFVNGYFRSENTKIPSLSMDTIIGTGMTSGVSGNGIQVNVDGGFLRIYAAYGLVMCAIFYTFMFRQFFRNVFVSNNKIVKNTMLFFVLIILLGELKEFTIYQQYMVCLFFTAACLPYKQQIKSTYVSL